MNKLIFALPLVALLAGCTDDAVDPPVVEPSDSWEVSVTPDDFVQGVDNRYFPLTVGATWTYEAATDEGIEVIVVTVLPEARQVWGLTAMVVRDTVTVDGELAEDTWDWFAQDQVGNVWYFGEDTCEYEDGECVDNGAWEAGVDGALPGIVMLADPQVGDAYYQEYDAGEAEDHGEVVAVDVTADVPVGGFMGCIKTRDTTMLEPDVEEFKTYCSGVGLVLEEEEGKRVELVGYQTAGTMGL